MIAGLSFIGVFSNKYDACGKEAFAREPRELIRTVIMGCPWPARAKSIATDSMSTGIKVTGRTCIRKVVCRMTGLSGRHAMST